MNWTALLVVAVLVLAAAGVWMALAAKMVAEDEGARAQSEAARRDEELEEDKVRERRRAPGGSGAE
ncbi:MAG: hypothetical protein ACYTGB_12210 [Planctomycetota bacterium]|jgi:hypothetical protein